MAWYCSHSDKYLEASTILLTFSGRLKNFKMSVQLVELQIDVNINISVEFKPQITVMLSEDAITKHICGLALL
jgi:hypothetical protein